MRRTLRRQGRAALFCALALSVPAAQGAGLLNEILLNPPGGADTGLEYVELRGQPNRTLPAGTCLVAVEGDAADNPGIVQNVFDLSGRRIGGNGFLVLAQKSHPYAPHPLATLLANDGVGEGWGSGAGSSIGHTGESGQTNIENPSCTFFLIETPIAPVIGDDIDANNDGTPDGAAFAAWTIHDSVGVLDDGGAGDIAYGRINFRRDSVQGRQAAVLAGSTVVSVPFTPAYVARVGNGSGWTAADWLASDALGGTAPGWTLGANVSRVTNTVPVALAGAALNHLGSPNFGAAATPAVLLGGQAEGVSLFEGGESAYWPSLNVPPAGPLTLQASAAGNAPIQISTDGGASWGSARVFSLSNSVQVKVRALDNLVASSSPRFYTITHQVTATGDPARYPMSTIVPNARVRVFEDEPLLLNELKVNPPGANDGPFEYVEIQGRPGAGLSNVHLVAFEGDPDNDAGVVRLSVNLTGAMLGANGLLFVAAPGHPYALAPGTAFFASTPFGNSAGAIPNGPVSIWLCASTNGFALDDDLDGGDNGVLEDLPADITLFDCVAWRDSGNDVLYGGVELTQPHGLPDAATRLPGDTRPRDVRAWANGDLAGASGSGFDFADDNTSTNFPPGTVLTPGRLNESAPTVSALRPLSGVIGDPDNPSVTFSVADGGTPPDSLTVTVTSTNQSVVPNANLVLGGAGAIRTLAIEPTGVGYTEIVIDVSNGTLTGRRRFRYAASAPGRPGGKFHAGISDASTVMPLDAQYMLVGDDENQILRLYDRTRSGVALALFNMNPFLGLIDFYPNGQPREVDIEGSIRVGNRIYWMGSHSHSQDALSRTNRGRLFATDLAGTGTNISLTFVGRYDFLKPDVILWDVNNLHGKGANYYGIADSAAIGVDPKSQDGSGFNFEGLALAPGGAPTAYLGLRAPLVPPTNRARALILPITNFTPLAAHSGPPGSARFGPPIELDLGGRGIRSLEANAGGYLIVAGLPGPPVGPPGEIFKLYTWTGNPADAPQQRDTDLSGLNPEAIVELPTPPWTPSSPLQLVSDNGVTEYYGDGVQAKFLPVPEFKKFRSDWVTLGNIVAPGPRVLSIAVAEGEASLTWASRPGATYRVQEKPRLDATGWQDASGDVPSEGIVTTATVPAPAGGACFYRVIETR